MKKLFFASLLVMLSTMMFAQEKQTKIRTTDSDMGSYLNLKRENFELEIHPKNYFYSETTGSYIITISNGSISNGYVFEELNPGLTIEVQEDDSWIEVSYTKRSKFWKVYKKIKLSKTSYKLFLMKYNTNI